MLRPMKAFRIGAGAGYAGDRIDPAQALAERGGLDALVFECLAERTIALAQLRRAREPEHGYDPLLQARMRAVLPACVRQGVTIVSNMGAAHPEAAGAAVLAVARELGLKRLRVAVVTGDDVLSWVQAHDAVLLDSTQRASDLGDRLKWERAGATPFEPLLQCGQLGLVAHALQQFEIAHRRQRERVQLIESASSLRVASQVPDQDIGIDQHSGHSLRVPSRL